MVAAESQHLVKWPTRAEDMTVDLMLRVLGAETQHTWLAKDATRPDGSDPLYHERLKGVLAGVGLMACVRALRNADPVYAEAFVRDYWRMCDAGDCFGELLWEYTEAAGLDPSHVTL